MPGPVRVSKLLETLGINPCCNEQLGNPLSLTVAARTELKVNVELPWGSPTDASIVLKTSFVDR